MGSKKELTKEELLKKLKKFKHNKNKNANSEEKYVNPFKKEINFILAVLAIIGALALIMGLLYVVSLTFDSNQTKAPENANENNFQVTYGNPSDSNGIPKEFNSGAS